MDFPASYYKYKDVKIKWLYIWGKFETGVFFHCTFFDEMKDGEKYTAVHSSLHTPEPHYYETVNERYILDRTRPSFFGDNLRFVTEFNDNYMRHKEHNRTYYCNPKVKIVGKYCINDKWTDILNAEGWVDEESSDKHWAGIIYEEKGEPKINNWNWVGIKLDDGRSIVVYNQETSHYCAIMDNNEVQKVNEYKLSDSTLLINDIDMEITLESIAPAKVFNPELGMKYSEQPMKVIVNGEKKGFAMRERTYGGC